MSKTKSKLTSLAIARQIYREQYGALDDFDTDKGIQDCCDKIVNWTPGPGAAAANIYIGMSESELKAAFAGTANKTGKDAAKKDQGE